MRRVETRPTLSRVLAEIERGPASRIVVSLDSWKTGDFIRLAILRQTKAGTWYVNRSFGFNVIFAEKIIDAIAKAVP